MIDAIHHLTRRPAVYLCDSKDDALDLLQVRAQCWRSPIARQQTNRPLDGLQSKTLNLNKSAMLLLIPETLLEPKQIENLREFAIAIIDEDTAKIVKDRHYKCKIEDRILHFPLKQPVKSAEHPSLQSTPSACLPSQAGNQQREQASGCSDLSYPAGETPLTMHEWAASIQGVLTLLGASPPTPRLAPEASHEKPTSPQSHLETPESFDLVYRPSLAENCLLNITVNNFFNFHCRETMPAPLGEVNPPSGRVDEKPLPQQSAQ